MMQQHGAEMAGFFQDGGGDFPNWACYKSQVFPREERGRYNLRANSFAKTDF
jgi:hypothetical protein